MIASGFENQKWKEDTRALLCAIPSNRIGGNSGDGAQSNSQAAIPFPWKLHDMLDNAEKEGFADVVSWQSGGKAFRVHQIETFVRQVMPSYFNQTKYKSFQRQLNLYGFQRISRGAEKGLIFHEFFVRNQRALCLRMNRERIKGQGSQRPKASIAAAQFPTFASSCSNTLDIDSSPVVRTTMTDLGMSSEMTSVAGATYHNSALRLSMPLSFGTIDQVACGHLPLLNQGTVEIEPNPIRNLPDVPQKDVRAIHGSVDCQTNDWHDGDEDLSDGCPAFFEGHRFFVADEPHDMPASPLFVSRPFVLDATDAPQIPEFSLENAPNMIERDTHTTHSSSIKSTELPTSDPIDAELVQNMLLPCFAAHGSVADTAVAMFSYGAMMNQDKKDIVTFRARYQGTAKRSSAGARAA